MYITVLYCTVLYRTALHCTVLHCSALHCAAYKAEFRVVQGMEHDEMMFAYSDPFQRWAFCTAAGNVLHFTALYCTVLYYTAFYCTLHCTIPYRILLHCGRLCTVLH